MALGSVLAAGFFITGCAYDRKGVSVDFWTHHEPPYVVAIFPGEHLQFPYRTHPITNQLVWTTSARFSGDFISRGHSFVQVFTPAITNGTSGLEWRPSMTDAELDSAYGKDDFSPGKRIIDGRAVSFDDANVMYLDTWGEDRSQCVPLLRKVVPLSSNGSDIISMDWLGRLGHVEASKDVEPFRIYWQGL